MNRKAAIIGKKQHNSLLQKYFRVMGIQSEGFYLAPRCAALSINTPTACMIKRADGKRRFSVYAETPTFVYIILTEKEF